VPQLDVGGRSRRPRREQDRDDARRRKTRKSIDDG
jgi:hypothetical protein